MNTPKSKPSSTPRQSDIIRQLVQAGDSEKLARLCAANIHVTDENQQYLHWRELKDTPPPPGLSSEEYWIATRLARQRSAIDTGLCDRTGKPFSFCIPASMQGMLFEIARLTSGKIRTGEIVSDPIQSSSYRSHSLTKEAAYSCRLDGATFDHAATREVLRFGDRQPETQSEQLAFNTLFAINKLRRLNTDELTPDHIIDINTWLTAELSNNPNQAGQLRNDHNNESIFSEGTPGSDTHLAPPSKEISERLQTLCAFINGQSDMFVHPFLRAIIAHFMLLYDRPFLTANGATARALFYWLIRRQGYWLLEFVSISKVLFEQPNGYLDGFKSVQDDDNDLTYFLFQQLHTIFQAMDELEQYLREKEVEIAQIRKLIKGSDAETRLNLRQIILLKHALENPQVTYTIHGHAKAHGVGYLSAKSDLLALADKLCLLDKTPMAKIFTCQTPIDLRRRVRVLPKKRPQSRPSLRRRVKS